MKFEKGNPGGPGRPSKASRTLTQPEVIKQMRSMLTEFSIENFDEFVTAWKASKPGDQVRAYIDVIRHITPPAKEPKEPDTPNAALAGSPVEALLSLLNPPPSEEA
jgi:hypothetical protein